MSWQPVKIGELTSLKECDCHVWLITLPSSSENKNVLNTEERVRAARFKFDKHRQRFIANHTALRHILASYTNTPPQAIQYSKGQYGKPFLTQYPNLHFNLSHSGDRALIAIAKREIGIDIEKITDRDELKLAKHFFTDKEYNWLSTQTEVDIPTAFFKVWTRKEAILKATGLGLHLPLDSFNVIPLNDLTHYEHHVENINIDSSYQAAIAYLKNTSPLCIKQYILQTH